MKSEQLALELAASLKPVEATCYGRICAEWLAVTLGSFLAVGGIFGFRSDLDARMHEPLFAAEIALNILLIFAAGFTACTLAYPDRAKATVLKPLLAVAFAGYAFLALQTALTTQGIADSLANTTPHGIACLLCILGFAAAPALYMFWRLKKLATVRPMLMGAIAMMMAVATGCLGVRLVENEIMPTGLILWHYLPLILFSGLGLVLGRKIFRW